jgi:5-methylcytosine-specific restriction endonuclease McrA
MPIKPQGHKWRTLRANYKAQCQARNAPCWLDGQPIDYGATPQSPLAFEIDHAIPRAERPDLAYDLNNLRPSHARCNRARANKPAVAFAARPTRWTPADW